MVCVSILWNQKFGKFCFDREKIANVSPFLAKKYKNIWWDTTTHLEMYTLIIHNHSMRHAFTHGWGRMPVKYERSTTNIEFVWVKTVLMKIPKNAPVFQSRKIVLQNLYVDDQYPLDAACLCTPFAPNACEIWAPNSQYWVCMNQNSSCEEYDRPGQSEISSFTPKAVTRNCVTELFFKNQSETSMWNLTPGVRESVSGCSGSGYLKLRVPANQNSDSSGRGRRRVKWRVCGWQYVAGDWSLNIIIEN